MPATPWRLQTTSPFSAVAVPQHESPPSRTAYACSRLSPVLSRSRVGAEPHPPSRPCRAPCPQYCFFNLLRCAPKPAASHLHSLTTPTLLPLQPPSASPTPSLLLLPSSSSDFVKESSAVSSMSAERMQQANRRKSSSVGVGGIAAAPSLGPVVTIPRPATTETSPSHSFAAGPSQGRRRSLPLALHETNSSSPSSQHGSVENQNVSGGFARLFSIDPGSGGGLCVAPPGRIELSRLSQAVPVQYSRSSIVSRLKTNERPGPGVSQSLNTSGIAVSQIGTDGGEHRGAWARGTSGMNSEPQNGLPWSNANNPAADRPIMRPFRLTFHERDLELEYERFFLSKNLLSWRRTMFVIFCAATLLYAYVMIRSPHDGSDWQQKYSDVAKGNNTESVIDLLCPQGWFCILGLVIRFVVVEPDTPVYESAILLIMLIYVAYMFMRIRFIYTVVSVSFIVLIYVAINAPHVATASDHSPSNPQIYVISCLALVVVASVVSFSCYETEVFYRAQFLSAYMLQKTNAKLTNQLKVLQKAYGNKVADFDSPLEKSVMILRSMMADPSLGAQHLMALGQVMVLLQSSNLLTPDLENQLGELLDNEQEAWLFSEIAPRRSGRTRGKASRRPHSIADVAGKVGPPIAESAHNSNMNVTAGERSGERGAGGLFTVNASSRGSIPANLEAGLGAGGSAMGGAGGLILAGTSGTGIQAFGSGSNASGVSESGGVGIHVDEWYSLPLPGSDLAVLLSRSNDFNWSIFEFVEVTKGRPLSVLAHHLFRRADLFNQFQIPLDKFRNFVVAIETGYHSDLPCTVFTSA
ncbi:hypothetical protein BDK51DRAFT_40751 [Blyttiomyces helicus]|uniref:PDEase domain-containing protein n=1 Tax=Blyttiomyces helicus TaxID=388810 RepID=A0A4P9WGV8_9FUNG|nr:hypothetical protein BDK51DRAFT_40751 [Blyttiomyces helicus]|eukprot:RKO89746.1 hypothetical protein BDK51DRAFT_40751 [Blyttiomyces helicus]